MAEKRIETVEMRAGDVKTGFGNPRKITKKKKDELRNSIETFGDFGSFIIDENDKAERSDRAAHRTVGWHGAWVLHQEYVGEWC